MTTVLSLTFLCPMEQATLIYCRNCKSKKPSNQFKLREKDNKYGRKGEPTGRCLPCAEKERHIRRNNTQRRDHEGLNPEPDSILPVERFTVLDDNSSSVSAVPVCIVDIKCIHTDMDWVDASLTFKITRQESDPKEFSQVGSYCH